MEDYTPEPNRTLGWAALSWATEWLTQPDGPNAGETWRYTPEQVRIILRWYEINSRGDFVNRRGVIRRMKGWGKDPFLASIAAIEACGPCRFSHWRNGTPIAMPVSAPWIQIAAVSKDQTRNTMTLFPGMFSKEAISEFGIDMGKEIIYVRNGRGRIEAVTSSPRALEGGRPTLVILNETHHWIRSNEGTAMAEGIRRNLGKSRDGSARSMEITNAHLPGEGSVAEASYEAWRKSGGQESGVYYDSLESSLIKDVDETIEDPDDKTAEYARWINEIKQGIVVARGDSTWVSEDRLADEIADPVTPLGMSKRFYLNQVTAFGGTWLPEGTWDACGILDSVIPAHTRVVLALDGSFNGDSTALLAADIPESGDPITLEVVECWEAPPENPLWRVPRADVRQAIRDACRHYQVVEIVADPHLWSDALEELEAEGLPVLEYPQSPQRMTPATSRLFQAIVNKAVKHNSDSRLNRHISNAVLKVDARGNRLSKESKSSNRKIDLAVTAVMAHDRALSLSTAPAAEPPGVWSLRELTEEIRAEEKESGFDKQGRPNIPVVTFHRF